MSCLNREGDGGVTRNFGFKNTEIHAAGNVPKGGGQHGDTGGISRRHSDVAKHLAIRQCSAPASARRAKSNYEDVPGGNKAHARAIGAFRQLNHTCCRSLAPPTSPAAR